MRAGREARCCSTASPPSATSSGWKAGGRVSARWRCGPPRSPWWTWGAWSASAWPCPPAAAEGRPARRPIRREVLPLSSDRALAPLRPGLARGLRSLPGLHGRQQGVHQDPPLALGHLEVERCLHHLGLAGRALGDAGEEVEGKLVGYRPGRAAGPEYGLLDRL